MSADTDSDHDPLDPFRRDQEGVTLPQASSYSSIGLGGLVPFIQVIRNRNAEGFSAFRLVPLVYSPGPDGELGILTNNTTIVDLDPYFETPDGFIGSPVVDNGEIRSAEIDLFVRPPQGYTAIAALEAQRAGGELVQTVVSGFFIALIGFAIFRQSFVGSFDDFLAAALWGFTVDLGVAKVREYAAPVLSRKLPNPGS